MASAARSCPVCHGLLTQRVSIPCSICMLDHADMASLLRCYSAQYVLLHLMLGICRHHKTAL